MTALRRWFPCLLVCGSLACAHATKSFTDYPSAGPVALAPDQDAPEVTALVSTFYDQGFEPKQLRKQVASVLARYPHASRALASGERQDASSISDRSVRFRKLEPGSITVIQFVHYQPPGAFLPNHFADTRFAAMLFTESTIESRSVEHPEHVWHPLQLELELNVSSAIQTQEDAVSYRVEAQLPEGLRVVQAPASFEVEHPCFTAERQTKVTGRRVEVALDYTRRCANVSVADYPEFRRAALRVQKQLRDEIVFAREPEQMNGRVLISK